MEVFKPNVIKYPPRLWYKVKQGSLTATEKGKEGTISEVAHCTTAAKTEKVVSLF